MVTQLTKQVVGVKVVNFSSDLTSDVQRSMVRARINWIFLRWSFSARDLDTCVLLCDEPLYQCTIVALAIVEGQRPIVKDIRAPVTRVAQDSLHSIIVMVPAH